MCGLIILNYAKSDKESTYANFGRRKSFTGYSKNKKLPFCVMLQRNNTSEPYGRPSLQHNKMCNMLFADGHVAANSVNDLKNIYSYYGPTNTGKVSYYYNPQTDAYEQP